MPPPSHELVSRIGLYVVLVLASTRLLAGLYLTGEGSGPDSPLLYPAATLAFNYVEMGAVRRGLGGTIARFLSADPITATIAFHMLSAAALAFVACLLFGRIRGGRWTRAAAAIALLALVLRWAEDAGRTDMTVAALLGGAAWAVTGNRLALACALIGVGLFVHETSLLFGLPLLAALVWRRGIASVPCDQRLRAVGVLALTIAAYASIFWLPHADVPAVVRTVRARLPSTEIVDAATYFALSGARGVRTSICQNVTDPGYWIHPFGGVVAIVVAALAVMRQPGREWPTLLLAALPPFVFLCVVANDIARWTTFAAFNVWLLSAATSGREPRARIPGPLAFALAVALFVLTYPKPQRIEHPIYAGSPLIEQAALKLGWPRTPGVLEALQRCDPGWRGFLDERPAADEAGSR